MKGWVTIVYLFVYKTSCVNKQIHSLNLSLNLQRVNLGGFSGDSSKALTFQWPLVKCRSQILWCQWRTWLFIKECPKLLVFPWEESTFSKKVALCRPKLYILLFPHLEMHIASKFHFLSWTEMLRMNIIHLSSLNKFCLKHFAPSNTI